MKAKFLRITLIAACASPLLGLSEQPSTATSGIDYKKVAERAEWAWKDDLATPFYGISQAGSEYDITMVSDHQNRSVLTFKIARAGKEVYAWKGHDHTVFRIQQDRLYYALFHPSSSGGEIVAVDLSSGKELWKSPLTALGPIQHSAYRSLMALDANAEVVSVYGNESMGRYFEVKDAKTGTTLGHKRFSTP